MSQIDVTGKTSLHSRLEVGKSTVLKSSLNVWEKVDISGNVDISGSVTIFKDLVVKGTTNFSVGGTTTLTDASVQEFTITEAATLESTLKVSKTVTLSSVLDVLKAGTLRSSLSVAKATTINSTLDVLKAATLNST